MGHLIGYWAIIALTFLATFVSSMSFSECYTLWAGHLAISGIGNGHYQHDNFIRSLCLERANYIGAPWESCTGNCNHICQVLSQFMGGIWDDAWVDNTCHCECW